MSRRRSRSRMRASAESSATIRKLGRPPKGAAMLVYGPGVGVGTTQGSRYWNAAVAVAVHVVTPLVTVTSTVSAVWRSGGTFGGMHAGAVVTVPGGTVTVMIPTPPPVTKAVFWPNLTIALPALKPTPVIVTLVPPPPPPSFVGWMLVMLTLDTT